MTNKEKFLNVYAFFLEESVLLNPQDYAWGIEELPAVLGRMNAAIERGNFNKDGRAFKLTCKHLRIKHTYRDIETYLGS